MLGLSSGLGLGTGPAAVVSAPLLDGLVLDEEGLTALDENGFTIEED